LREMRRFFSTAGADVRSLAMAHPDQSILQENRNAAYQGRASVRSSTSES
jgi:hypothetical protein